MRRDEMLARVEAQREPWDVVVVGGGATGLGAAVDAAARGYDTLLLERGDFAGATSSQSTKLIHGGVRYLKQLRFSFVREALDERRVLRRLGPHLVHEQRFVIPCRRWRDLAMYAIGLRVYDALAEDDDFQPVSFLDAAAVQAALPGVRRPHLRGGVAYSDAQFDDARFAICLARTAADLGGALVNYAPVRALTTDAGGRVDGVRAEDLESGGAIHARARVVVNAAGPFVDDVRRLAGADASSSMIVPSQGAHLVFNRNDLTFDQALLVPKTPDGRVLFAIPWEGAVIVGTTDTPLEAPTPDPRASEAEIDLILETLNTHIESPLRREHVRSTFCGVRPLVRAGVATDTAALSRDHVIQVDPHSRLVTIAGGKWTTYRRMGADVVDQAAEVGDLPRRPSPTRTLALHGRTEAIPTAARYGRYGADASAVERLARLTAGGEALLDAELDLTAGEVRWHCREEMARTVEDVLARRRRALPVDARVAARAAPAVARLMAQELGRDAAWEREQVEEFDRVASRCLPGEGELARSAEDQNHPGQGDRYAVSR